MSLKALRDLYLKLRKSFLERKLDPFIIFSLIFLSSFFFFLFLNFKSENKDKIYREGVTEDVKNLTPYFTTNETEKAISNIIFPSLFEIYNGQLISKFVSSYSLNSEKNQIEITLFDNLFWSDGEKLTTEDIRFGLEFAKKFAPSQISKILAKYSFQIINENQGFFKLSSPLNYGLYYLKYVKPLPSKHFSKFSPDFLNPELAKVGSGPFVLENIIFSENKKIVLKKNKNFREKVYLEKIEFIYFENMREAINAFLLKEIDGLSGLSYPEIPPNLKTRVRIYNLVLPRVIGIFFNKEKINPENLIDYLNASNLRAEVLNSVFKNRGEITKGIFSNSIRKILGIEEPNFSSNPVKPENLNKDFEIYTASSFFYPDIARILRDKYGFKFRVFTNEELNEIIKTKNYTAILYGINYNFPPQLNFFFSQAGLNLNSISDPLLEKKFFDLNQNPEIDPLKFNKEIELEILKSKTNFFIINPYYQFLLSKDFVGYNTFFISEISERFIKIQDMDKK